MFLELPDFLTAAEVARLTAISREVLFIDGRVTNPTNTTKTNLQVDTMDPRYVEPAQIAAAAFARSREFTEFAMPKKVAPVLLSRYEAGMKYGPHADTAFMAADNTAGKIAFRSDLSCTIFLNDPNSYEGGELVLHMGTLPIPIKGLPGQAFVYPSTLLHEVRPVRSGQRLVAITFIESMVPDERLRNALFEIKDVLSLEGLKMDWVNRVRLEVVIQNFTRLWSVP